jgi:hypothetical protein
MDPLYVLTVVGTWSFHLDLESDQFLFRHFLPLLTVRVPHQSGLLPYKGFHTLGPGLPIRIRTVVIVGPDTREETVDVFLEQPLIICTELGLDSSGCLEGAQSKYLIDPSLLLSNPICLLHVW